MSCATGILRLLPIGLVCLCLHGCKAVGPNFTPQREPWSDTWTTEALAQAATPGAQGGTPEAGHWWRVFGDPTLDALIAEADAHNVKWLVVSTGGSRWSAGGRPKISRTISARCRSRAPVRTGSS